MNIVFDGVASQIGARVSLMQALKSYKFPQSVLIEGIPGIGKKKLAMGLADLLVCQDTENRPCGKCYGCRVQSGKYEDMTWVVPVEITGEDIKKKEKRDVAIYEVTSKMVEDPYSQNIINRKKEISIHMIRGVIDEVISRKHNNTQIIFIPEADLLNPQAANALLKTLEEVPKNCYFILTTAYKSKLLPTIKSRCLTVSLPPMSKEEVEQILKDRDEAIDDVGLLYAYSGGSVGRALDFSSDDFDSIRESALTFLEWSFQFKFDKLLAFIEQDTNVQDSNKALILLDVLYGLLKDIFNLSIGIPLKNRDMSGRLESILPKWLDQIRLQILMEKTQRSIYKIKSNCQSGITISSLGLSFADKY